MNTIINVIPDFEHPLSLHNLDYEEMRDPESGATQYILVNAEAMEVRSSIGHIAERSLDEAAQIAAKTATVLFELGMDVGEDELEQDAWFKKHPIKKNKQEVNRIPDGTPPAEILKIISNHVRDNVLYNTAKEHRVTDCCYKQVINERGATETVPIFNFDIKIANKIISSRKSNENTVSNRYGLDPGVNHVNPHAPLPPHDLYRSGMALKLAALLTEYDKQVVQDAAQLRTYITNKLIEISSCGNPKDELRALELLGKVSDVGLFVEKSEVNIVHTSPAALEHAIKDRINRLIGYKNLEIEDAQFESPSFAIADAVRAALDPQAGGIEEGERPQEIPASEEGSGESE